MRDLSKPLAPTFGDPVKKNGSSNNKSCTPTNMKHCSAYSDNAKGPGGNKGGSKKKRKGKMFGRFLSGNKTEDAYYRSEQMKGAYPSSGGTKDKSGGPSTQKDKN